VHEDPTRARLKSLNAGKPVVNYGIFLAWANGLLPRAVDQGA
jgi:hypothetical protein